MDIITPIYNNTRTYGPLSPGIPCASPMDKPTMREYPVVPPRAWNVNDAAVTGSSVAPAPTMNGAGSSVFGMQGNRVIYQQG